jgi:RNA ligase
VRAADYLDEPLASSHITNGFVKVQRHPTERLWIFNYTSKAQFENQWDHVTRRCRGLITNDEFVVARPFEKFFNWGQVDRDMLPRGPIRVQDKMDGSLGILYQEPSTGRLAIATRGSFTSDQALHATEVLRTRYEDFVPTSGVTYLFEIIYPANRIVVDYGSMDDLVLLDIIDNETGRSWVDHHIMRSTWPGPVAERFEYPFIEDVLNAPPRPGREGFVVTYDNGFRVKIKQEEYVRLHRLLTGVSNKTIWEMLSSGEDISIILDRVPDEYYHWVKNVRDGLEKDFKRTADQAWQAYASIMQSTPLDVAADTDERERRKWFASKAKDHEFRGLLFLLYDEKDESDAIWRLVKPEYAKPFWSASEDVA